MVSAWSSVSGVVLGQEKTAEKSNEITAIPEQIIKQKGDYLFALKGNQGHLHE